VLSGGERSLILLEILDRRVDLPDNLPYVRIRVLFNRAFRTHTRHSYRQNVPASFRLSTQLYPLQQENLKKKRNLTGHSIGISI
jgi:hypothetical protein